MLNFLKKAPVKTLFFVVGTLCLVGILLAGAPIGIALLAAIGLSALFTLAVIKTRKPPEPDFFNLDPKLPPIPTISPIDRNRQAMSPPPITPSAPTNNTLEEHLQALKAKDAASREAFEEQWAKENNEWKAKAKAAQQKLQEMRDKEKDLDNKHAESIKKIQDEYRKKLEQCAPEEREALVQSCNKRIAALDDLLKLSKESNKKAILLQKSSCDAIDAMMSSREAVKKYNGQ